MLELWFNISVILINELFLILLNTSIIIYINNLIFGSSFEGDFKDNELSTIQLWQRIDFSAFTKFNKNQIKSLQTKI